MSLTLIVTLFNSAEYITECLSSIEKQTIKVREVIIINDGSDDNSENLAREFVHKNHGWRYYSQTNHGVGFTRNRAMLLATSEFIGFLDSDDYISNSYCADLLDIAAKDKADVVLSNFHKFDQLSGLDLTDRKDKFTELGRTPPDGRLSHIFGGRIFGLACASIFKRSLFIRSNVFFPANTYHEDIFVMPRLYANATIISHCDSRGYFWRSRADSESHSINSRHILSILHALADHQKYLTDVGRYDAVKREFTTYCIMYLNSIKKRVTAADNTTKQTGYLLDLLASAASHIFRDKSEYLDLHGKSYADFVNFAQASLKSNKFIVNSFRQKPLRTKHSDILFFPHKTYHTITMLPIARELQKRGVSSVFVDMTNAYGDEAAYRDFNHDEFLVIDFSDVTNGDISHSASVFMNDWDLKCALPTVTKDNALGRATFGIVEGVQDFWDRDTGRHRNAYQSINYLIAAGEHDLQYFSNGDHAKSFVGGVPRILPLLEKDITYPATSVVLINSNFTYGVLEAERLAYLHSVENASTKTGMIALVTKHPQDVGDLSQFKVSEDDMYTAISNATVLVSRFSSAIIESIAMGKPAIYYNPNIESIDKFIEPMGAFAVCINENELTLELNRIKAELQQLGPTCFGEKVRSNAGPFLSSHCGIGVKGASPSGIADFIFENIAVMKNAEVDNTQRSQEATRRDFVTEAKISKLEHDDYHPEGPLTSGSFLERASTLSDARFALIRFSSSVLLDRGLARNTRGYSNAMDIINHALTMLPDDDPIVIQFHKVWEGYGARMSS